MWWIIVTAIGLMLSALMHYLYRHTYQDYGYIDGKKVWNKKYPVTRGDLLLCYGINIIPLINIVVLPVLLISYCMEHNDYDFHIVIDNKLSRWLKEEI